MGTSSCPWRDGCVQGGADYARRVLQFVNEILVLYAEANHRSVTQACTATQGQRLVQPVGSARRTPLATACAVSLRHEANSQPTKIQQEQKGQRSVAPTIEIFELVGACASLSCSFQRVEDTACEAVYLDRRR